MAEEGRDSFCFLLNGKGTLVSNFSELGGGLPGECNLGDAKL
jgi:hypothetical protein